MVKSVVIFVGLVSVFLLTEGRIYREFINDPPPGAPFSQAVIVGNTWVYVSGQQGLDPNTGELVRGGAENETFQALKNIEALVQKAGGNRLDIIKLTNYVVNMSDLEAINRAYPRFFTNNYYPARVTIQVSALPDVGLIEIDAVAVVDNS